MTPAGTATTLASLLLLALGLAVAAGHGPQFVSQAKAQQSAGSQPVQPDKNVVAILIHTTLVAYNQANLTGNYSVLRDLASPNFRRTNSSARLANIFKEARRRNLNLNPTVLFKPHLLSEPWFDKAGKLRLKGYFPTKPQRVTFDLAFEWVDGTWQLFGIGVGTVKHSEAMSRQTPKKGSRLDAVSASRPKN